MTFRTVKVATASLNLTVYDFARNADLHCQAIDKATEDGADILSFDELSGTGYPADDYHQWNKNNDNVASFLQYLANYAQSKNPNLVLSVGVPWHYADKSKPANDPEYNINNRPFNTHVVITDGKIVAMSAKSILADGPAEYEPRQFNNWPVSKGTITIDLPDGRRIPFGKPILWLGNSESGYLSLTHEICAEGWPGVHDDLTIDRREQNEARHIVGLAKDNEISIVLNPSASKPQPGLNKEKIRMDGLCKTGSMYCGLYVYTNYLASASGTYAAEGSQIFAQNGKIVHHGKRYSFKDMAYSSYVAELPAVERCRADVVLPHAFFEQEIGGKIGEEALFDSAYSEKRLTEAQLAFEENARSICLWLRDYLAKQAWPAQGYTVSLSGGKDSAAVALAVTMMVELEVTENGIDGFLNRFSRLKYADDVRATFKKCGEAAAVWEIKKNILTCIYLPTENSSQRTLNAARFLVEGGALPNGEWVEGIGGTFCVAPVQGALDEITAGYTGLNLNRIAKEHRDEILAKDRYVFIQDQKVDRYAHLSEAEQTDLARSKLLHQIKDYVGSTEPKNLPELPSYLSAAGFLPLPTWADKEFDLTLQNLQARTRLPFPWAIANQKGQIALVSSNESEAVHGYTTAGGDMHMGGANPIGGVSKSVVTDLLKYAEDSGLQGLQPVRSLFWVNNEKPTAELRKQVEGVVAQTDETDLGFTYPQSQFIEIRLLEERKTPLEVFTDMKSSPLFASDPMARRSILLKFIRRWESAQFKRIMGPLAPYVGSNVDPHQSVRTTILGDHFRTLGAQMSLTAFLESGGPSKVMELTGRSFEEATALTLFNADFRSALLQEPEDKIKSALISPQIIAANDRHLTCLALRTPSCG